MSNNINDLQHMTQYPGTHHPLSINKYKRYKHGELLVDIYGYTNGYKAIQNEGRYAAPSSAVATLAGTSPGNFQFNDLPFIRPIKWLLGHFFGRISGTVFDRVMDLIKPVYLLRVSIDILKLNFFYLALSTINERTLP